MNQNSISENLCQFIRDNLVAKGVAVAPETSLTQLLLDSFSIIEIVLFIERKYGLTLPDEALSQENIESAHTLAGCVEHFLSKS